MYGTWGVALGIEIHIFHDASEKCVAISGIVNSERVGIAQTSRFLAQNADTG